MCCCVIAGLWQILKTRNKAIGQNTSSLIVNKNLHKIKRAQPQLQKIWVFISVRKLFLANPRKSVHMQSPSSYSVCLTSRKQLSTCLAVSLTVGSLSGTGWGWLWCRVWSPPRPACSHSRHTWGSPRASTYRGPSAGSGPWSSGCSRHSLLAWCPAGRRAFVYLGGEQRERGFKHS